MGAQVVDRRIRASHGPLGATRSPLAPDAPELRRTRTPRSQTADDASARRRRIQQLESWRAELESKKLEPKKKPAPKEVTSRRRSLRPGLLALLAALLACWQLSPAALTDPLEPPAPEVLSPELGLEDMVVVGDLLHVRSSDSESLEPWQRAAAMETACVRAQGIGFRGLVFYDSQGDVSHSCVRQDTDDAP